LTPEVVPAPATLLVTGATGYLGRRVVARAVAHAAGSAATVVVAASRAGTAPGGATPLALDLLAPEAVARAVAELRPDAVLHLAAANPGAPEHLFDLVNAGGARAVAEAVGRLGGGCRLVSVSTDVVHDGRRAPYADDAEPSPLSAYGRSKAEGEVAVLEACPGAAVVRTSLIYGLDEVDRSTAGFVSALERGGTVTLFSDVWRQPVWVESLAEALVDLALVRTQVRGRLNVAGRQVLSRAGFGRRLLEHFAVPGRRAVREGPAAGRPDVPLDLRLRLDRADQLGYELPGVDDVLAAAGSAAAGTATG